ncbi:hypothetical protein N7457_004025 [Penicillium paradoxum]|uniref:uncharacterized protein n=1 Tax=Penicillium paradoxum TaxID=176176 RepID=UPI0025477BEA|nr:uncharacterized protein N7457_004025 [Penicillium paradoxum]KAJ5782251.1 hypothetical protein N7457_004025 [Penicillium paradoxum]
MDYTIEDITREEPRQESSSPIIQGTNTDGEIISVSRHASQQELEDESSNDEDSQKKQPTGAKSDAAQTKPKSKAQHSDRNKVKGVQVCIPASKRNSVSSAADSNSEEAIAHESTQEEPLIELEDEELGDQSSRTDPDYEKDFDDETDSESSSSESSESSNQDDSEAESMECSSKVAEQAAPKKRTKKRKTPLLPGANVKGLMTSSILSNGASNASDLGKSLPVSKEKDKSKALKEEVTKLPIEDQPQARKDMNALIEDSRMFDRSASIVEMNWKIKGVQTHLKHHQLRAAAWMRRRESSDTEPNGGLLCDDMGLGKTLTVLAIIAHEKLPGRSKLPTLIIVPRSLITQWTGQISTHCDEKVAKHVLEYYAGSRTSQRDVAATMRKRLIVLTTYEQICSSYPKLKPPVGISRPEELEAWRKDAFNREAGPFHKIDWHRIVLDEAHVIKNKDAATSIAVRALSGKFKWAMSGTPLHNGVEELYPYLDFIYTTERMGYETFIREYQNGLDAFLGTIMHRSTYSTRILGKPVVMLPRIQENVIQVEFCPAEQYLYGEMQDLCVAMLNGMAGTPNQNNCILAMITYLRMFAGHPLLAQKMFRLLLKPCVIKRLEMIAKDKNAAGTSSCIISTLILKMNDTAHSRPRPEGDFTELLKSFITHKQTIGKSQGKEAAYNLMDCPACKEILDENQPYVVTSCHHRYCKGCFDGLPDQKGNTDTVTRICSSCKEPIKEAGYSDSQPKKRKQSHRTSTSKSNQRSLPHPKPQNSGKRSMKKRPRNSFKEQVLSRDQTDDVWEEPDEDEGDWISRIGDGMPSAKTTAIRDLVAKWMQEDEAVKIVIFVQFLDMIRLLQGIFAKEEWKFATLTGQVSPTSRDKEIEVFGKEKDTNILLSSLKTGGVGLNLTMANKCILVDPWWNAAIQNQAYCRLYRIGQTRPVECVQIVAKRSVDTWMVNLQKEKTWNIQTVLSNKEMLGLFGDVHEDPNGVLSIETRKENSQPLSWYQGVQEGIFDGIGAEEED